MVFGVLLIAIGGLYLWKPTIFRRGIWMKTSIAVRTLSEVNYTRYMRALGVLFVIAGIVAIIAAR